MKKHRVGILGATGTGGQRFIQLLENHPQFEITAVAASDRSQGKTYGEACTWRLGGEMPAAGRSLPVQPPAPALHLDLLALQRRTNKSGGFIVTNPNCSTVMLALALAPLHARFGITSTVATTMQALSGAGYPGVASLDIIDNVLPHVSGEEEKMETETKKILGRFVNDAIEPAPMAE